MTQLRVRWGWKGIKERENMGGGVENVKKKLFLLNFKDFSTSRSTSNVDG